MPAIITIPFYYLAGRSYSRVKRAEAKLIEAEPIDVQSVKSKMTALNNKAEIESEATFDKLGYRENI